MNTITVRYATSKRRLFLFFLISTFVRTGYSGSQSDIDEKGRRPEEIERQLEREKLQSEQERKCEKDRSLESASAYLIEGNASECAALDRLTSKCIIPIGTVNAILRSGSQPTAGTNAPEPAPGLVRQARWYAVRPFLERAWLRERAEGQEGNSKVGGNSGGGDPLKGVSPAVRRRMDSLAIVYGREIDRIQDKRIFQVYSSTDSLLVSLLYDTLQIVASRDHAGIVFGMAPSAFNRNNLPETWVIRTDTLHQGRWCPPFRSAFAYHTLRYIGNPGLGRAPIMMHQWILRRLAELTSANGSTTVPPESNRATLRERSFSQDTSSYMIKLVPERARRLERHARALQDSLEYARMLEHVPNFARMVRFFDLPNSIQKELATSQDSAWSSLSLAFGIWLYRPNSSNPNKSVYARRALSSRPPDSDPSLPYGKMLAELTSDYFEKTERLQFVPFKAVGDSAAVDAGNSRELPFPDWVRSRVELHPDITPDPT